MTAVPEDVPVWSWLFSAPHFTSLNDDGKGFTDALTEEHITFREVKALSTYLSTALVQDLGLVHGDSLIIYSPNTIMYPVAMLAAARSGVIACGVSPEYTVDELAYALKASKAKALVAASENWERACQAADKVGLSRTTFSASTATRPERQWAA